MNNSLIHLNLEGMNLQEDLISIVNTIKNESFSLYSVHLNDNEVDMKTS